MILALLLILSSVSRTPTAPEHWVLVSSGPDYAYGMDVDSVITQGTRRAFVAASVEPGGVSAKATIVVDCEALAAMVTEGDPAQALWEAVGRAGETAVGAGAIMLRRTCAPAGEGFVRSETARDFTAFLAVAEEFIGWEPPVACGPPPSHYVRAGEKCP